MIVRAIVSTIAAIVWLAVLPATAHDHSRPGLDTWYQGLNSRKGPCCDGPGVDAYTLADVDWESKDGHYRVRIEGRWINVPPEAVLDGPNLDGRTLVWPIYYRSMGQQLDRIAIRCFMPGSMT